MARQGWRYDPVAMVVRDLKRHPSTVGCEHVLGR
jgi:hypothetical protein